MRLATPRDIEILKVWGLDSFYGQNRSILVDIIKRAYKLCQEQSSATTLNKEDIEPHVVAILQGLKIFQSECVRKASHVSPSVYIVFAQAIARVLLDNEWTLIAASRGSESD